MKNILLFILLICITTTQCYAIETQKIYLNEAIKIALENNIDLKSQSYNINISKNNILKSNRLQNPEINLFSFFGGAGENEPQQIGISQTIEINKRLARKNLAISELELAKKEYEYSEFDLAMDVREAYINLVAVKSILETLEQQEELQEQLLEIAGKRIIQKKSTPVEAMRAEVALDQILTQVNTARANVKAALYNFNKIINSNNNIIYDSQDQLFTEENNFNEMLTPPPTYNFPSVDYFEDQALNTRYDIKIAKQNINKEEKNIKQIQSLKIPDMALSSGYSGLRGKYTPTGNYNSGAYIGLNLVNIPVFYQYKPEIQNAHYKLEQAKLNYISVQNKAKKDISSAYQIFLASANNLNKYEKNIIKNSQHLMNYSLKNYEEGNLDITELIVLKQSYKSVIIGYTYALSDYYNNWTNFLREINNKNFIFVENI